ncbi:MAG: helix-turn-helix domain-containing protein [Actinomycetota bacterium]|nr:helix-turn-helix domain-containing protein [Actinomycetota bacterium]
MRRLAVQNAADAPEPALVGCWENQGWSEGLGVGGQRGWPRGAPSHGSVGLATEVVAREARGMRVSACCILVDTHCIGVKSAIGPRVMGREGLVDFKRGAYGGYERPSPRRPTRLAQHLVFGAIEYARRLGFEPAADFDACAGHLGAWSGPSAIRFGRHGKPMYVAGPYDDASRVISALERSVGQGNFDFVVCLPA